MKKWVIISVAATMLLGGGAATYFIMKSNKTATTTDSSQSTTISTTGKFTDACKVITKTAADTAFGVSFQAGKSDGNGSAPGGGMIKSCKYDEANDGSPTALFKAINLSVQVDTYASADAAKVSMNATKTTDKVGGKVYFVRTDVPEVGDEAFFFQGQAAGVLKTEEYLYARKANQILHFVAVRLEGIDHNKAKAALTNLAKQALK